MVSILLEAGANARDADTSGATALHYAAGRGATSTIELLLDFAADVEAKDDLCETPLMWARGERSLRLLLDARADPHARNSNGQTALMLASRNGDVDRIRLLAQLPGMDLDACDKHGCSAHAAAVAGGHSDSADLLVSLGATAGAQPRSRIVRREEALLEAARRNNPDACQALCREGADIQAEIGGETALLVATAAANSRVVEVLLQGKADPNHADPFLQETPLMRAVLGKCSAETLWLLLEARADPLQKDLTGRTAADVATAWNYKDAADILKAAAAGELDLSLGAMD